MKFNNIEPNELAEEAAVAHVALAIVDLMATTKVTQRQLATALGVSEARVSQILAAEQNLTVKTIARIASALGHRVELKFIAEPEYAAREVLE
jgi:transcriptional regulator with XRE-family HTH domain